MTSAAAKLPQTKGAGADSSGAAVRAPISKVSKTSDVVNAPAAVASPGPKTAYNPFDLSKETTQSPVNASVPARAAHVATVKTSRDATAIQTSGDDDVVRFQQRQDETARGIVSSVRGSSQSIEHRQREQEVQAKIAPVPSSTAAQKLSRHHRTEKDSPVEQGPVPVKGSARRVPGRLSPRLNEAGPEPIEIRSSSSETDDEVPGVDVDKTMVEERDDVNQGLRSSQEVKRLRHGAADDEEDDVVLAPAQSNPKPASKAQRKAVMASPIGDGGGDPSSDGDLPPATLPHAKPRSKATASYKPSKTNKAKARRSRHARESPTSLAASQAQTTTTLTSACAPRNPAPPEVPRRRVPLGRRKQRPSHRQSKSQTRLRLRLGGQA